MHSVLIYDKFLQGYAEPENLQKLSSCQIVFVAVPTPYDSATGSCDVSAVEEIVRAVDAPLCIKSTVPPGTTDFLSKTTGKRIAFSPEYVGESQSHPWLDISDCGFVIVGGDAMACDLALKVHELVAPNVRRVQTTAVAAELVKYMENSFLATKVAFVNQFYDLALQAGADFGEMRELFLLDSRIGQSHTGVTNDRGFGGKCLPKDLQSIIAWARGSGGAPLLEAVLEYNDSIRSVPK